METEGVLGSDIFRKHPAKTTNSCPTTQCVPAPLYSNSRLLALYHISHHRIEIVRDDVGPYR